MQPCRAALGIEADVKLPQRLRLARKHEAEPEQEAAAERAAARADAVGERAIVADAATTIQP